MQAGILNVSMSTDLEMSEPTTALLEERPAPAADTPANASTTVAAPSAGADVPRTIIEPPCGWQLINVRELWQFRELLGFLTWRDVKVRYKQTLLGAVLGRPAAGDDDGRVHGLLRPHGPSPHGRHPLSALRLCRPVAVDVLRHRHRQRRQQRRRLGAADHQDLLPAAGHPVRLGGGGRRRFLLCDEPDASA